ncbi:MULTISPECIES: putative nitrogen fixation protein NifT [Enterobacter]|jgi:nitrogen fixation protein NifT|uniref:putative nitrogen fixation protein NifT n=1 Tax=Enterobacter TaxID=547 RepID=UPI0015E9BC20|nr:MULTISPECIES: putative nitrogen fixation protein NifT [Enterobacter]HDR2751529.1 putative nitrogen fixation protein NifT [Enterobacter asburiae]QMR78656.1 putative nitrogen fixation protein NifT [Enterobacter sp. RHBSTW-00175]WNT34715.1 putative nitrogen fixation protein NifT [Enterobacter cloacae]HDR2786638.1 putative nitrogen fixation protein NifT [Enterobacter asburiae]HDR2792495.1 putative nitrogen fixation protein NifT [Enterobacter asburiae]
MPVVIIRQRGADLYCYIAKQDLEAKILVVEHDTPERWGGTISLEGGRRYYVNVQPGRPSFPISLRATRDALV